MATTYFTQWYYLILYYYLYFDQTETAVCEFQIKVNIAVDYILHVFPLQTGEAEIESYGPFSANVSSNITYKLITDLDSLFLHNPNYTFKVILTFINFS